MKDQTQICIDYLHGRLSESEQKAFEDELQGSEELRNEFEEYKKLFDATREIAKKHYEPHPMLMEQVMKKVEREPKLKRRTVRKVFFAPPIIILESLAITAVLVISAVTFLGSQASKSFSFVGSSIGSANEGGRGFGYGYGTSYSSTTSGRSETYIPYDGPTLPANITPLVEPQTGERYGQHEESAPQLVTRQPVSTFSIDVDTGSYTNMRRFIQSGRLPPQDSVRIEEYLNYFHYDYPTADDGKPFAVNYEMGPSPLQKNLYLLKVGIKTKPPVYHEDRGWNLVFLIDVSGSMSDNDKLPLLKKAFRMLVTRMRPTDKVGIVTYAGEAGVLLESTPGSEKDRILSAIDQLGAGGSTNGSGGITAAYDLAQRSRVKDGVNRIILATDGDFNVGISSFDDLVKLIEEKRESGITLTSVGVGSGNYNERNLEQLADKGNGNYFYLDSINEAERVFGSELASNMEVVAKDVKLQLEFNPKYITGYRLIGYDNRKLRNQDFDNDAVDAGEIGAGHTVTALYEIMLTGSEAARLLESELRYQEAAPVSASVKSREMAFLKIRYKEPNGDKSSLLEFPLDESEKVSSVSEESADFRFAAAVSGFGQVLRRGRYAEEISLSKVRELAEKAIGDDQYGERKEFLKLVEKASAMRGRR